MEEPEKTTAQLRAELAALRQCNTHLEATMARWQRLEDTVRFPTFLRRCSSRMNCTPPARKCWLPSSVTTTCCTSPPMATSGLTELGLVAFHASTLRRAVLNLVQNALDAMPSGGTVTLAGQGTATHVQLQVRDTGSGIPVARWDRFLSRCLRPSREEPGWGCTSRRRLWRRIGASSRCRAARDKARP
jgi:signal transduction histidine kinase